MISIYQFNNILDDREFHKRSEILQNDSWKLLNKPDQTDNEHRFWIKDLMQDTFYTTDLFETVKHTVSQHNFDVELHRVYANGQTFGQHGRLHQDYSNAEQWTFLIYFNHQWDIHWGGHTIVKDLDEDKFYSFLPVPNSAIFFRGDLWHVGLEPTSVCPIMRTTVAYKLNIKET